MKMFKKRTDYGYYSSYGTKSRRKNMTKKALIIVACVVAVIGVIGFINRNRIKLMVNGYSWSQTSDILSLDGDDVDMILSYDKLDHMNTWLDQSKKVTYYDEYEKYLSLHKKMKPKAVVKFVNHVFSTQSNKLKALGYSNKEIWSMLETASIDDLQFLIDHNLAAETTKPFRNIEGCILQNMDKYMTQYKEVKDYNYAVCVVNYPFILSSQPVDQQYTITNPNELTTLVKNGFNLPKNYEPDDLVTIGTGSYDMPVAPDCQNNQLRKACATALMEMYKAATDDGYHLVLNSGYRSYDEQERVYKEFESKYGGQYAAEYVANPGASEHQTGLGVDMTAQSVVDGKRLVFGDTSEYKWVVKNCAQYGFIIRFPENEKDVTGIKHEPWHLRYVGKKAAKEITDKNWTYEDYCLYNNIMPEVTKK